MAGFFATLAITGAGLVLGLIIAHFSSRREPTPSAKDLEELKRRLFELEQGARDLRQRYETEKV